MNRRTLLRAGAALTATLASATSKATTTTLDCSCQLPSIEAGLYCEKDVCAAAANDFGNIIHSTPRAVLTPASAADVAAVVRSAREQRLRVAARGQGHSTYGRCMAADGIVVDMRPLSELGELRADRITVGAGATWSSVLDATIAQGMTPPVLTNYLNLSVGGTLSIGGIGGTSSRFGMQVDQVLELEAVTGDGWELKCSRNLNPDLFDALRGGLGQCGIITRATLALTRAPDRARRYQLFYPDLASLVADQQSALSQSRFDELQGAIIPDGKNGWRYQLEGAVHYRSGPAPNDDTVLTDLADDRKAAVITDLTYQEDARGFEKLELMLRSKGLWTRPQPWLFTFLSDSIAERVASEVMQELSSDDLGAFGRITFYPTRTNAFQSLLARLPNESVAFAFNIIRSAADEKAANQMLTQNRAIYERVRNAGGMLYPVSAFPMTSGDWKAHFGSRWQALAEARRRYDPGNVLTPGYEVF